MKVIDFSPFQTEDGKISLSDRIKASFKYGFLWYRQMQAQQVIVRRLEKILDNKFTLVRNPILGDLDIPIPLILVGPPGVTVIYTDSIKGIYRAKGEVWSVLDNRSNNFRPQKPNLLTRTMLMVRAVSVYLASMEFPKEQVEGVLILSNPGTHVDTMRPSIRVVLSDAVERFASGLIQTPRILSAEAIKKIVDYLTVANEDEEIEIEEYDSSKGIAFSQSSLTSMPPVVGLEKRLFNLQKVMNFTKKQWLLLFLLIFIELVILIGFIILVFMAQV